MLNSYIHAERLSAELSDYVRFLEKESKIRISRLRDVLMLIDQIFSDIERNCDDKIDRRPIQQGCRISSG